MEALGIKTIVITCTKAELKTLVGTGLCTENYNGNQEFYAWGCEIQVLLDEPTIQKPENKNMLLFLNNLQSQGFTNIEIYK
jgi:hypothetical protein